MKIHNPETLRKFMAKHKLTMVQVAKILGYSFDESRHWSMTVHRMKRDEYNWETNGAWVSEKLNEFVSK